MFIYEHTTLIKCLKNKETTNRLKQLKNYSGVFVYWIKERVKNSPVVLCREKETNKIVGWCILARDPMFPKPTIGWYVDYDYRKKGIAKELAREMMTRKIPRSFLIYSYTPTQKIMNPFGKEIPSSKRDYEKYESVFSLNTFRKTKS